MTIRDEAVTRGRIVAAARSHATPHLIAAHLHCPVAFVVDVLELERRSRVRIEAERRRRLFIARRREL